METCPEHGTPLLLRRNQGTGEVALACIDCDLEQRLYTLPPKIRPGLTPPPLPLARIQFEIMPH